VTAVAAPTNLFLPMPGVLDRAAAPHAAPTRRRVPGIRGIATALFLALAATDTLLTATCVSGSWWLVLLLVWLMPRPAGRLATGPARPDQASLIALTTLAVLSWLFFRACSKLQDLAGYFQVLPLDGRLEALNCVMQTVAAGLVAAALIAPPLWRAFGTRAVAAAFVVATPWFIASGTGTAFEFDRWLTRPISSSLWLFAGAVPLLFLMEACSLRNRLRARSPAATSKQSDSLQVRLTQLCDRAPGWLAKSTAPLLLLLTAVALTIRFHFYQPAVSPPTATALTSSSVLCTLLLTAALVHQWRSHRARRRLHATRWRMAVRHLTLVSWSTIVAALWGWILFVDAPLAEHNAFRTLAALPGPAWTLDYKASTRTLSLTGRYQYGVAAAFTAALDGHPDTRTVKLAGPGGREYEGLAIARAIETRGLATRVSDECVSACTLAFLGGHERILTRGGRLGFHAVSAPIFVANPNADSDAWLASRGVEPDFIRQAAATPPKHLWFPTSERLVAARVVTVVR
jgi:hypothetical protein